MLQTTSSTVMFHFDHFSDFLFFKENFDHGFIIDSTFKFEEKFFIHSNNFFYFFAFLIDICYEFYIIDCRPHVRKPGSKNLAVEPPLKGPP